MTAPSSPPVQAPPAGANRSPSPDLSMPHHAMAEQTVLAHLLHFPEVSMGAILEAGGADLFFLPTHRNVFEAIASLFDDGKQIDLLSLACRLDERHQLGEAGGQAGLRELLEEDFQVDAPSEHFPEWCAALRDLWVRRELIRLSMVVIRRSLQNHEGAGDILDHAEWGLTEVRDCFWTPRTRPARGWVLDVIHGIEEAISNPGTVSGLATGFRDLDAVTSGLHPGELTLIVGTAGCGKTSLAANIASHLAVEREPRVPVGWFTCQETGFRAMQRILSLHSGLDLHGVMGRGLCGKAELTKLMRTATSVAESPLLIHEEPLITTMELRHLARSWKRQNEVGLIIVDGLPHLKTQRKDGVPLRLADAAAVLKGMARELAIPVLAFADSPLPPRHRRPGLQDLGELREAVSEADMILWLDQSQRDPQSGRMGSEVHVLKQRHGPSSTVRLMQIPDQLRFEDWTDAEQPAAPDTSRASTPIGGEPLPDDGSLYS